MLPESGRGVVKPFIAAFLARARNRQISVGDHQLQSFPAGLFERQGRFFKRFLLVSTSCPKRMTREDSGAERDAAADSVEGGQRYLRGGCHLRDLSGLQTSWRLYLIGDPEIKGF